MMGMDWASATAQAVGAAANTGAAIIGDQMKLDQQAQAERRAADIKLDLAQRMAAAEEMLKTRAAERFSGVVRAKMGEEVPVDVPGVGKTGLTDASATQVTPASGGDPVGVAFHGDPTANLQQMQAILNDPKSPEPLKQEARTVIDGIKAQMQKQGELNAKGAEGKTRKRTVDEASQAALDDTLQNDAGAFMAGTGMLAASSKQDLAEKSLKLREEQINERLAASRDRTEMMGQIAQIRADAVAQHGMAADKLPSDAKMIEYLVAHGMEQQAATDRVVGTGAGATKDPVAMAAQLASSMISSGMVRVTKDDPAGTTLASKAMTMASDQISAAEARFRATPTAPGAKAPGAVANPMGNDPLGLFRK